MYLAADAVRHGHPELERGFRTRALISAVAAGAVAIAGLVVLHSDFHPLYHSLTRGPALAAVIASVLAGVVTMALFIARRYELSRYTAAAAVGAIIAAWALARWPMLLPHLTIDQAASGHDTLVWVTVAVLAGGTILFPSLALLFRLTLGGQLGESDEGEVPPVDDADPNRPFATPLLARGAVAALIAGVGLLNVADAQWAHAIGVVCLLTFVACAFFAIIGAEVRDGGPAGDHAAVGTDPK